MNYNSGAASMQERYNIAAIRRLMRDAFTADDLGRFCQDRPEFRPILSQFGPGFSFETMIETTIEQCEKKMILHELLVAVQEANPRQFERYRDQILERRARQRVINLRPLDMTRKFRDREGEIQALRDYLADSNVRLVNVVGRGGIGKTALVSHVLADLEQSLLPIQGQKQKHSVDGILYLSARSTDLSLERIYTDVGRMLGEPTASRLATRWMYGDTSLATKVEYLLETMCDGQYIILLDNLEDYLTKDGEVSDEGLRLFIEYCLARPSGVNLISTSRREIRLPPATLTRVRTVLLREGLPEKDAVSLLHELDPNRRLGLRDASRDELQSATQLVQGIPRALELLAGILDRDPTANLPSILADERLFGEWVVEELVAEGYARLGSDEQRIIEALAVLNRPVVEKAIVHLLQPWVSPPYIRESLRHLVGSYFVSASRVTGEYSLHPLDREYAYSRIPDNGAPTVYNRRSLELRAADFYASTRKPENEWRVIDDLSPQLAEFEHRVRAADYEGASQVLSQIDHDYLLVWGHYNRVIELRSQLLEHLQNATLRGDNYGFLGLAHYCRGQLDQAIRCQEQALIAARLAGDRWREGIWLGYLGRVHRTLGKLESAIHYFEQALDIACATHDHRHEGIWRGYLGQVYRNLWILDRAIEFQKQSLAITHQINDRVSEGERLGTLGSAYRDLGQLDNAISFHDEALSIAQELGNRREESIELGELGQDYCVLGLLSRAASLYERAIEVAREIGDRRWEGRHLGNLSEIYLHMGQTEHAIGLYREALSIAFEIIGYERGQSDRLLGLGRALMSAGKFPEAQKCCEDALSVAVPRNSHQAAATLGIVLLLRGSNAAEEMFDDAVARCRAIVDRAADVYEPRYALATALVGNAVCDSRWTDERMRQELLAPALKEYEQALNACAAAGVIQATLRDLEMIRAAGVEGLEPAFDLLRAHLEDVGES